MPNRQKIIRPIGNMDKDSDVRYVGKSEQNKGDTIDNRNTQIISDSGSSMGDITPTLGNEFAFSLGSVSNQNKTYRITLSGDSALNHQVKFLSTTKSKLITNGTGPNNEVEFNGTVASCQAAILASNNAFLFNVTTGPDYVDVTLTGYAMYQWYLESVGTDDVAVTCIAEAIPTNLAGPLKDIGSYDLLGDLFIFSTTQDNEPTDSGLTIASVGPQFLGNYTGPITQITFTTPHGLEYGNWFRITDCDEPFLNGIFVVHQVVSPTVIEIITDTAWGSTPPVTGLGTPIVTIDPNGIGEIGVAQKDENNDTWSYTRLLRSVELNFVSKKAIRTDGRIKGRNKIIYYTDKYNEPRRFIYSGEYLQDGALTFNLPENIYVYDSISDTSNLLSLDLNVFTDIQYVGQSDSGGNLTSGNKYYVYRFLDSDGSVTNWSDPTRAIPVFPRSIVTDDPVTVKGGAITSSPTTKVVNLSIQGIPQGIFESVEVGVLDSDPNGAVSGTIFNKIPISEIVQSIDFSHTGQENDTQTLDVGEVAVSISNFQSIATSGDLTIIDGRLVMGNITYKEISNIEEWASQIKHSLSYRRIKGMDNLVKEKVGGYLDPENVYKYPSLTIYETYRVGIDVEFIDGSKSPTFWVDDIRIDTLSTNTANPTDNRRVPNGGLPDYVLNGANTDVDIFVPHIVFSNIDMNFILGGVTMKDLISSFTFRFAEIKKEVLASGFVVMGVSGSHTVSPVQSDGSSQIGIRMEPQSGSHCQYLNWNNSYRQAVVSSNPTTGWANSDNTRAPYPDQFNSERRTCFFYSPEVSMGNLDNYEYQAADRLNVFYPMRRQVAFSTLAWNGAHFNTSGSLVTFGPSPSSSKMLFSDGCELTACPPSSPYVTNDINGVNQYNIDDAKIIEQGDSEIVAGVNIDTFHKEISLGVSTNSFAYPEFEIAHAKCLAIRTSSDVFPYSSSFWQSNNVDYGVYYAQLFRESPNKYGDVDTTEYQPYGQKYSSDSIIDVNTGVEVYGGDSFTVKTLLTNRFVREGQPDSPAAGVSNIIPSILSVGRHLGMTYFSQSYMNMELINPNDDIISFASYPESFTGTYVNRFREFISNIIGEYKAFYNPKYSYGLTQITKGAFSNELNELVSNVPTRIIWSSRDIYSSIFDNMRTFLPLNIHDLDGTFGELEVVENVNGELVTLQERKFQRQPFNARGELQTSANSVSVLLGSGSVMSQDGKTLSTYGTTHKWSAIRGLNSNGKDVLYWINQENGLVIRFGEDGTRVISSRGMKSFFANYTKWIEDKYEHAYKEGVRGVWDDRRQEVIWTFTAWRNIQQTWTSGAFVEVGEIFTNTNAPSDSYENFPRFFRCIQVHTSSSLNEPGVGADWEGFWEQIPYTDPNYYSIFTICFNEMTNGFRCFYGHLPKTYLKWQNTFLSSHPIERNLIFEHRRGQETTWYGVDTFLTGNILPKIEDAYFESVVNEIPEQSMRNLSVSVLSESVPDRIEYRTKGEYTYDEFTNPDLYESRDDSFVSTIKNDATQTGDPDGDGSMLKGSYLRVKFIIFGGAYNLLHSIVVKFIDRTRRIIR